MKSRIPEPRIPREEPKVYTAHSPTPGETPEKVKDILATGRQPLGPIKRKPFYPFWETKK